jgi:pimeloyl-ACP methyl ester carboxylesterase
MRIRSLFIFFLFWTPVNSLVEAQTSPVDLASIKTIATSFRSVEGFVFDAKIVAPPTADRNGYGLLMLGGGQGNDLEWTVPGFINNLGEKQQLTITGESHADAPRIATVLAERGFVVMYWSTIRQDDPKRDGWPNEMTIYPVRDLFRFSKSALAHFRGCHMFDADKVILLGHSLGGVRAINLAAVDGQVRAVVLMSSAQATRTSAADRGRNMNRESAAEFIQSADGDGDGMCSKIEFTGWSQTSAGKEHPLAQQTFEQLDFHPDDQLVEWEIAAGFARANRSSIDFQKIPPIDSAGLRWTEDLLKLKKIDTLFLYGTLDRHQAHHAPIVSDLIQSEPLDHVEIKLLPDVGHQLGPEVKNLLGPISRESTLTIADWLINRLGRQR